MREKNLSYLMSVKDTSYKEFHQKLVPNIKEDKIIGVRVPVLRNYAKALSKENYQEVLRSILDTRQEELYYEERVLAGLLIGYSKESFEIWIKNIKDFVPIINNWGVCDTACSSMKIVEKNRELTWEFLQSYLDDHREYYIRFGVVMLLDYFITDEYIDKTLQRLTEVKSEEYYAMMAVAWAISICFIKFPEKTWDVLKANSLDEVTHNKAIQKIRESYRVDKKAKDELLQYKR